MFLHLLDNDQKHVFFELASEMMAADGIIADEEIAYMDRLVQEAGLHGKQSAHGSVDRADLTVFNSRQAKLACALELLILAVIDGDFHVKEAVFANDIIDMLGLDEPTHDALCRMTNDAVSILNSMQSLTDDAAQDSA